MILRAVALESGRAEPERHVDALGHEVLVVVCRQDLDLQLRVLLHKRGKPRDDFPERETCRRADTERAAQLTRSARLVVGLVERRQDRLNAHQVRRAGLGQCHRSQGAAEERRADLLLERGDQSGCRRLRQAELAASTGKVADARGAGKQSEC